jgi:hypothetical protein
MKHKIVKYIILGVLILLTYYSFVGINYFSTWRDTGNDYFDIENEAHALSGKESFSKIVSIFPFFCFLSITIYFFVKFFLLKKNK